MEKRIGVIAILIEGKSSIPKVNEILSRHSEIILARQGLPFRDRNIQVISLIIEASTDQSSSLSGALGRIDNVTVKAALTAARKESSDDKNPTENLS